MGFFKSKEIEQLKLENEELKNKFHIMYEKEENVRNLDIVLKRLRSEVVQLNEKKNSVLREIELLMQTEKEKHAEAELIKQQLEAMKETRDELQNKILTYTNQLQNLEAAVKEKDSAGEDTGYEIINLREKNNNLEETKEILSQLEDQHSGLLERLDLTKQEIEDLKEAKTRLNETNDNIEKSVEEKKKEISFLEEENKKLSGEIDSKKKEIIAYTDKINSLEKEYASVEANLSSLRDIENRLKSSIEYLTREEKSKVEFTNELKEIDKTLEEKRLKLEELEESFSKLSEEASFKQKELYAIDQSLGIKSNRLSKLNLDLLSLEKKSSDLREEVKKYDSMKAELYKKLSEEKSAVEKLVEQNSKLREIVPLLEKRKKEIEQSNAELESRFTEMFQKFNRELNDINKKRSVLEQIILKKEKDVEERDQTLFEKISALEESESILNARQAEIEAFENQIKYLKEQKDLLQNDLQKIDDDASERKDYNNDLRLETELLMKKRMTLEKSLQEILKMSNDNLFKAEARKLKLNDDMKEYEEKLEGCREKINESMNQLVDLQASIGTIRAEEEERKSNVSKLVSMKKRLRDEILRQQATLQKFQKIREKIKLEQTVSKNKQIGGPYQGSDNDIKPKSLDDSSQKGPRLYKQN